MQTTTQKSPRWPKIELTNSKIDTLLSVRPPKKKTKTKTLTHNHIDVYHPAMSSVIHKNIGKMNDPNDRNQNNL